jgi:rod shape-determining protein MreC
LSLRDGPLGDIKVPLAWGATIALIVAVVFAVALVLGDRRETMRAEAYNKTRGTVDKVVAPVGDVVSSPIRWVRVGVDAVGGYFFAGSQNRSLKRELIEAQKWRDEAIALREENARYRVMMGVKTDPPIPMVFARAVMDSRGPFANTRLVDAGSERGVGQGNPVLGQHGLVGRIVGVTKGASRVLLLTDMESRTPVLTTRTNARAILIGDGGPNPKLSYLRTHDPLKQGDRVLTSGDGGVFPRGLPVGVVVKGFDGSWRVALDADAGPIDYVQIMLFKDFSQLVDAAALTPKALPGAMAQLPNASILGQGAVAAKPGATGAATTAPKPTPTPPTVTMTTSPVPPPKPKPKPKPKPPVLAAPPRPTTDNSPPY